MLKNGLITSFLAVTALIALNPAIAQDLPDCASSGSDPDGDGYGWENNDSCIVVSGSADAGQCEDRGGYPWGWNPVTGKSCRLDNQAEPSASLFANAVSSHLQGTWQCTWQYMAASFDFAEWDGGNVGCFVEPSRRGNTFSTCDVQWEQGIFFNSYVYQGRSASYNTQVAEIVFNPDGSYQEFRIVEFGGNEETASELLSAGSWRVTNNGYGMSFVNADAVSGGGIFRSDDYSRLAQEIINGSEVFSVYSDDESRVSCTRL